MSTGDQMAPRLKLQPRGRKSVWNSRSGRGWPGTCPDQVLLVPVQPTVHGEPQPEAPGGPEAGAEGQDIEPAVALPVGPPSFAEVDGPGPVEADGPLIAELDGALDVAEGHRPGEGREVEGAAHEGVGLEPLLPEGVVVADQRDLGAPQIAQAGGVPGGRGRVVRTGQEGATHAVGPGPGPEGQVLLAGEVDPVLVEDGLGAGGPGPEGPEENQQGDARPDPDPWIGRGSWGGGGSRRHRRRAAYHAAVAGSVTGTAL